MPQNGFLILVERMLRQEFAQNNTLRERNWLFSNPGSKIVVHGPKRDPFGDPDILAEITSCPNRKWICIELKEKGTLPDQELLVKIIGDWAKEAEILTTPPSES